MKEEILSMVNRLVNEDNVKELQINLVRYDKQECASFFGHNWDSTGGSYGGRFIESKSYRCKRCKAEKTISISETR